jgi:hypothetical protein
VCYTALREPPAKQRSEMLETPFAIGQRQKASSSSSANKRDQPDAAASIAKERLITTIRT